MVRKPLHTPEEIRRAVRAAQEQIGSPALDVGSIFHAANHLEYESRDGLKNQLDKLAENDVIGSYPTGNGHIYWVPHGEFDAGEKDLLSAGKIQDLGALDFSEIPEEDFRMFAQQHISDYNIPSFYQRLNRKSEALISDSLVFLAVGTLLFMASTSELMPSIVLPSIISGLLAIIVIIGMVAFALSGFGKVISEILQGLANLDVISDEPFE